MWLSRGDVRALLGAQNLYRELRRDLPPEPAAEQMLRTIALEEFRAAVRRNCFADDDAARTHALVPVPREVYVVLKAMGLCGAKDDQGRPICILGLLGQGWRFRNWKTEFSVYQDASTALLLASQRLAGVPARVRAPPEEHVKDFFSRATQESIWQLARALNPNLGFGATWLLNKANRTATAIKSLRDSLDQWLLDRLKKGVGPFEREVRRRYHCAEPKASQTLECTEGLQEAAKRLSLELTQVVVSVALYDSLNAFWHSTHRDDTKAARELLIDVAGALADDLLVMPVLNSVVHGQRSLTFEDLVARGGEVPNSREALEILSSDRAKEYYRLGLPRDEVLEDLVRPDVSGSRSATHDFWSDRSGRASSHRPVSSPRVGLRSESFLLRGARLQPEEPLTTLLMHTLGRQYAILFDIRDERASAFLRTLNVSQLGDPDTARVVKTGFMGLFGGDHESLLESLRGLPQSTDRNMLADHITHFFEPTKQVTREASKVLFERGDVEENVIFLATRLTQSVLLNVVAERRDLLLLLLQVLEHSTDQHLRDLLRFLPVVWGGGALHFTLGELQLQSGPGEMHGGLVHETLHHNFYRMPELKGHMIQDVLTLVVRRHSTLNPQQEHPHYDPETILEPFRKWPDSRYCHRFGSRRNLPFSRAYIALLQVYYRSFGGALTFSDSHFQHNEDFSKEYPRRVKAAHEYLNKNTGWSFKLVLELDNGRYLDLDTNDSVPDLFALPFRRWMVCTSMVPTSARALVHWFVNSASLEPIQIYSTPLSPPSGPPVGSSHISHGSSGTSTPPLRVTPPRTAPEEGVGSSSPTGRPRGRSPPRSTPNSVTSTPPPGVTPNVSRRRSRGRTSSPMTSHLEKDEFAKKTL